MATVVQYLTRTRAFYIGTMFEQAASRFGQSTIALDEPLRLTDRETTDLTYAETARLVAELSARLWAAGIRAGQHVAIYKRHGFDIALLACAAARIGAVPALLSPELPAEVAAALVARLTDPWLLADEIHLRTLGTTHALDAVKSRVVLTAGQHTGVRSLSSYADAEAVEPARPHPREPMLITHSSGTTGVPKLAVHCAQAYWQRLAPQRILCWPIRRRVKAAMFVTFVHSRFYQGLAMFLSHGNPLVIGASSDPAEIAQTLCRTRPGYVETHPNSYVDWEAFGDHEDAPLRSVRYFGSTFDALHPRTIQRLLDASDARHPLLIQAYGQSELGPMAWRLYSRRSAPRADARCVGRPFPGFVALRAVDETGRAVKAGTPGFLEARSQTRILTYLGEEERYREQQDGSWMRLGDLGARSRWATISLLDREVDAIASIDSNLAVEDRLMSALPELREIVIVERHAGAVTAVVATKDDRPLDPIRWERAVTGIAEISLQQVPFSEIPRTSTRKVQRSQLIEQLRAGTQTPALTIGLGDERQSR